MGAAATAAAPTMTSRPEKTRLSAVGRKPLNKSGILPVETSSELPTVGDMPKLIIPLGRGSRGKTFFVRWSAERAQEQGRSIVIVDADRTNATLSRFFEHVVSPPSGDDRDVREFLGMFIDKQIEERFTAILDLGGGDTVLKALARELGLVEFLSAHGITPVAVHVLGPDTDDLSYLRDVEQESILAPPATILVMNEATVPSHRTAHAAFDSAVRSHPILTDTVGRGALLVRMPRLEPAAEVDRARIGFAAAEGGRGPAGEHVFGPFKRQQVAIWRRLMEESFAPVANWLP
jgi:hypothetical protein